MANGSAIDVLREGLRLARAHPLPLLGPLVLLGAVFAALSRGAVTLFVEDLFAFLVPLSPATIRLLLSPAGLLVAGAYVLATLLVLQTTRAAFMPLLGEGAPDAGLARRAIVRIFAQGLAATAPATLLVLVGLRLLAAPGLLLLALLLPLPAVLVAEAPGAGRSWGRCGALVRRRYGSALLLALLPALVGFGGPLLLGRAGAAGALLAGGLAGLGLALGAVLSAVAYARWSEARTAPAEATETPHEADGGGGATLRA